MTEESPNEAGEPATQKAEAGAGQPVQQSSEEGAAAARPLSKVASFRLRTEAHDTITARAREAGISPRAWLEDAILTNRTQIIAKPAKHPDLIGDACSCSSSVGFGWFGNIMWISLAPAIQQDASRLRPWAVQVFGEEVTQVVLAAVMNDAWRTVFALSDPVFVKRDAIPLGRSREDIDDRLTLPPAAAPSSADVLEAARNCLTSQQRLLSVAVKLLSALAKSPGSSSAETLARLLTPLCADYGAIARKTRRH